MIRASLVGLAVVCLSQWAHAEEANVGAVGDIGSAPVTSTGGESFASPNGQLGAGLTASPEQKGRAFVEMGFSRMGDTLSFGDTDVSIYHNTLSWIVGGGYKLTPELELVAMLPFAFGTFGASTASDSDSESGFALANAQIGVNYFSFGRPLRFVAGGAVQYGPWNHDYDQGGSIAILGGAYARGGQDLGLWAQDMLSIVTPARIEYMLDRLALGSDGSLGLHIPTDGGDMDFSIQVAPGLGYYVTPTTLVGLRVPFLWVPTESGSGSTQLAMEPYARFDFDSLFVATRFTLNIDEPLGFSFDGGRYWALHVGVGGSF